MQLVLLCYFFSVTSCQATNSEILGIMFVMVIIWVMIQTTLKKSTFDTSHLYYQYQTNNMEWNSDHIIDIKDVQMGIQKSDLLGLTPWVLS